VAGLLGHAAVSGLSLLSGVKRKLDFETAKGGLWRKAAVHTQTAVPRPIRTPHFGTRLGKGAYARFPIGTTFPSLRGTRDTTAALARSSKAVAMYFA
jgi:hypothetical protein